MFQWFINHIVLIAQTMVGGVWHPMGAAPKYILARCQPHPPFSIQSIIYGLTIPNVMDGNIQIVALPILKTEYG